MAVEKDPFLSPVFKGSRNLFSKTQMGTLEANSKKLSKTDRTLSNMDQRREASDALSPTSSNANDSADKQRLFRSLDLNSNFK